MCLQMFTECCPVCTKALPRKVSTAGHQPILTMGFGNRGQVCTVRVPYRTHTRDVAVLPPSCTPVHVLTPQVDLIDFQSCPDGEYKFLMNYQDHGVKFYDNRPLTHKTVLAVAYGLLDIFSSIAPPSILQADNGKEFSNVAPGKGKKKMMTSVDISDMVSIGRRSTGIVHVQYRWGTVARRQVRGRRAVTRAERG